MIPGDIQAEVDDLRKHMLELYTVHSQGAPSSHFISCLVAFAGDARRFAEKRAEEVDLRARPPITPERQTQLAEDFVVPDAPTTPPREG